MTRIIVGVDGSEPSLVALRWAALEAELRRCRLSVVMAWGLLRQPAPMADSAFDPTFGNADARRALQGFVTDALGSLTRNDVDQFAVCDQPGRALVGASEGADLLVVGTRGRGGFAGLLLGSVSRYCLHHALCPVTIVRERPADGVQPSRIVVGIDGSASSDAALRWAIAEARIRNAEVEVAHAWDSLFLVQPPARSGYDPASLEAYERQLLDEAVERAGVNEGEVRTVLANSGAANALLRAATNADLLVVGTRGHGGIKGLALGSVSSQVVQHAAGTVVVVPEGWASTELPA